MIKHNAITDIAIRIEDYFSDEIGYLSEDAWCDMQDNLKMIIENWLSENNIQYEKENQ